MVENTGKSGSAWTQRNDGIEQAEESRRHWTREGERESEREAQSAQAPEQTPVLLTISMNQNDDDDDAVVLVNCNDGYRWIYGMKLKSDMSKVVKKEYCYITVFRQEHHDILLVTMRDHAGEKNARGCCLPSLQVNWSQEFLQYFTSAMVKWTSESRSILS